MQLGMGLALLIYGYTSLASGISAYSWWNMVGLVWFAVITNLAAQSYLRKYYLEHPGQRQWRLWLLVTMIAALVVSMVPTVRMKQSLADEIANPQELLTTRALCYFPLPGRSFDFIENDRDSAYSSGYVLVLAGLIIVSVALLRQYEKPGSLLHAWRDMYRGDMQRPLVGDRIDCIRCEHRFLLLAVRPYMSFWLVLRLYADLANSILTGVRLFRCWAPPHRQANLSADRVPHPLASLGHHPLCRYPETQPGFGHGMVSDTDSCVGGICGPSEGSGGFLLQCCYQPPGSASCPVRQAYTAKFLCLRLDADKPEGREQGEGPPRAAVRKTERTRGREGAGRPRPNRGRCQRYHPAFGHASYQLPREHAYTHAHAVGWEFGPVARSERGRIPYRTIRG